jgi:hypothetical protein
VVSFTLHQTTSYVDQANAAPRYRVVNQVTASVGASEAVFVYKTATQVFEHYASAADMDRWPDTYEEAVTGNLAFYRVSSVSRDWDTLTETYADLDETLRRIRSLANELTAQRGTIAGETITTIEGV